MFLFIIEVSSPSRVRACSPPPPPTLSITFISNSEIDLLWTDVSGETSYEIERSTNGGVNYSVLCTRDQNVISYPDTNVLPDSLYYYRIRAKNGSVYLTTYSNVVSAHTLCNAPAKPTVESVASLSLYVTWSHVTGATGYKVYRSSGSSYSYQATTSNLYYLDSSNLSPGTQYFYKIVVVNDGGDSDFSEAGSNYTPPAINSLSVSSISASVLNLSWSVIGTATTYTLFRSLDGSNFTSQSRTTSTSFSDSGLSAGTLYYYKVTGRNAGGESNLETAPVASNWTRPSSPSPAPSVSSIDSQKLNVSWNGVASATSYNVYRSNDANNFSLATTTTSTTLSYWDTGLTAVTRYYYKVGAVNSGGESSTTTAPVGNNLTRPPSPSPAPLVSSIDSQKLNVSWNGVTSATSYNVYRSVDSSNFSLAATTTVTTLSYLDIGLAAGTRYYYKIGAVNSGGESSTTTAPVGNNWTRPAPPSSAPRVSSHSSRILDISWDSVTTVTRYNVYRSTDATNFSLATTTSFSTLIYSDTGLSTGTRYYYKIGVVNNGGESSTNTSPVGNNWTRPAAPSSSSLVSVNCRQLDISWCGVHQPQVTTFILQRMRSILHRQARLLRIHLVTPTWA